MDNWKKRSKRFVLFLDILGFKDMVARNSHAYVEKKLATLTKVLESIPNEFKVLNVSKNQSKAITFSDSILVFSRGAQKKDAEKILMDAHKIQYYALENKIPIKGAISYGEITVDFQKSMFFGQPIIDAFILHEDLQLLSVIVDHHAEKRFNDFKTSLKVNNKNLTSYETPMKYGKVNHTLLHLSKHTMVKNEGVKWLNELYYSVSGKPRIYIDNTLALYDFITNSDQI